MQITGLRTVNNVAVTDVPGTAVYLMYLSGPQASAKAEAGAGEVAAARSEPSSVSCSIPLQASMSRAVAPRKKAKPRRQQKVSKRKKATKPRRTKRRR
jgi:hypothetical protein